MSEAAFAAMTPGLLPSCPPFCLKTKLGRFSGSFTCRKREEEEPNGDKGSEDGPEEDEEEEEDDDDVEWMADTSGGCCAAARWRVLRRVGATRV